LAESLVPLWPADREPLPEFAVQLLAAVVIVLITAVAGKSAALALKLQIPIMMAVGVSILALAGGVWSGGLQAPEFAPSYRTAEGGFWYVFAVFFPAVTGFTAGIGMSGDLENPRRSIPRGTLLAVATGTLVYLVIPVLLGMTTLLSPEELAQTGSSTWTKVAVAGSWLVYPGIWGAILSSAFGSALGGPRVLQALASDGLAPRFLARLSKTGQPTVATWISGAIALSAVALGGLNAVAQFVTILFLTLYVTINLSAGLEQLVGDPSYRPTIRVPWYVSLLGSVGAIVVMALINPLACVFGIFLEILLYLYLRQQSLHKQWGDVRAGLWVAIARFALLKLRRHKRDPRNWRPHILLFVGDVQKRLGLVRLASWFHQDRGVVTATQLVVGDLEHEGTDIALKVTEMDRLFEEAGLTVFSEVDVVSEFERGVIDVTQANGFAGLHSNTVMFGWSEKRQRLISQLRIMRAISRVGKSTIIVRSQWIPAPDRNRRIDLWWGGLQNNGDMMLLLAYLLRLSGDWHEARLIVHSVVATEEEKETMAQSLAKFIPDARIQAETEIVVRQPGEKVADIIHRLSSSADVVFLGLMEPSPGTEAEYAERLVELAEGLRTTIFVRNAGEFAGNLI
jgi:amino acid transporter